MEETKKKVVKMPKAQTKEDNNQQPLSYDKLKEIAGQLQQQNKYLIEQLQTKSTAEFFKRIDYLFKVLELSNYFPCEFVSACSVELQGHLTLQENTTEDK